MHRKVEKLYSLFITKLSKKGYTINLKIKGTFYGRGEYYHINSSKSDYNIVVTSETGIPEFLESTRYIRYGIKVVSYLDEDVEVVSGIGTLDKPYVVSD